MGPGRVGPLHGFLSPDLRVGLGGAPQGRSIFDRRVPQLPCFGGPSPFGRWPWIATVAGDHRHTRKPLLPFSPVRLPFLDLSKKKPPPPWPPSLEVPGHFISHTENPFSMGISPQHPESPTEIFDPQEPGDEGFGGECFFALIVVEVLLATETCRLVNCVFPTFPQIVSTGRIMEFGNTDAFAAPFPVPTDFFTLDLVQTSVSFFFS